MSKDREGAHRQRLSGVFLDELLKNKIFRHFRHIKRGSKYVEIGRGEVQTTNPINEGDILVVYIAEDGKIWLRPEVEFDDGRFDEIGIKIKRA